MSSQDSGLDDGIQTCRIKTIESRREPLYVRRLGEKPLAYGPDIFPRRLALNVPMWEQAIGNASEGANKKNNNFKDYETPK